MGNIYKKIFELQKSVTALKKDSKSYGYDYLSGDKLFEVIRPNMDRIGLLLLPTVKNMIQEPVSYEAWDKNASRMVTKKENMCILEVEFTWVDVETGETLSQSWRGTGQNGFDKSFGSALTYAERYYLLKVFHIATNRDDVDAIAAERDEAVAMAQSESMKTSAPVQGTAQHTYPDVNAMRNDKTYWEWVKAAGEGRKTAKTGTPARTAFIQKYNPTREQLSLFDADVADYKDVLAQAKENK